MDTFKYPWIHFNRKYFCPLTLTDVYIDYRDTRAAGGRESWVSELLIGPTFTLISVKNTTQWRRMAACQQTSPQQRQVNNNPPIHCSFQLEMGPTSSRRLLPASASRRVSLLRDSILGQIDQSTYEKLYILSQAYRRSLT